MNYISVTNMESPELQVYSGLSEPQLSHYFEPAPGLFIAESPMIIMRAMNAGYEPVSVLIEDRLLDKAAFDCRGKGLQTHPDRSDGFQIPHHNHADRLQLSFSDQGTDSPVALSFPSDIPVYCAPYDVLTGITGYTLTRGILCAMRRKLVPSVDTILQDAMRIVILENVMNPTNTGAIFRSAAALGMDAVLLTRGCTDPLYRRAARVSMGTVFQIPWTYIEEWPAGIDLLHRYGFTVAAMTLTEDSVSLGDFHPESDQKIALVMGTEGPGLSAETVAACDLAVKIPMYHGVDSLNVAAASAVAFWQICSGSQPISMIGTDRT